MKRLAAGILDIHPSANAKTEVEVVIKMLTPTASTVSQIRSTDSFVRSVLGYAAWRMKASSKPMFIMIKGRTYH
jgi:hypothetical protein